MKNIIQKLVNLFGYKIIKFKSYNLDDITKFLITKSDLVILDVGANKGQSIARYKKLFSNPIIHSFEPNIDKVNILKLKYIKDKNLYLNNGVASDKDEAGTHEWPGETVAMKEFLNNTKHNFEMLSNPFSRQPIIALRRIS